MSVWKYTLHLFEISVNFGSSVEVKMGVGRGGWIMVYWDGNITNVLGIMYVVYEISISLKVCLLFGLISVSELVVLG